MSILRAAFLSAVAVSAVLLAGCGPGATTQPPLAASYAALATDPDEQRQLRAEAVSYLNQVRKHEYALYRANAIEALAGEPRLGETAAREGIEDVNLGVRFVAAMAIGQHRYSAAVPLVHAMLSDDSASVRAAAAYALKRNGLSVNLGPLAQMLKGDDPQAAGNAALVLGELGEASALPMLRESIEFRSPRATPQQQRIVQLQVAEAMAKLGDPFAVARIRAELYSRRPDHGEVMALAASMLGRLGAARTIGDLRNIVAMWRQYRHSAEVRLAALASLAQLGDPQPIELVLEYLGPGFRDRTNPALAAIQCQAVFALGQYPAGDALPHLARVLDSSGEEAVRIQAAAAILRLTASVDAAGSGMETEGTVLTPDDLQ